MSSKVLRNSLGGWVFLAYRSAGQCCHILASAHFFQYTLFDHRKNEEIWEKLKVETIDEKLRRYKSNWLRHVQRMNSNKMLKNNAEF